MAGVGIPRNLLRRFRDGAYVFVRLQPASAQSSAIPQSARPIPNAYDISIVQNGGFQRVSGFQAEVKHPTAHGLLFDGSWTWEKCLGDVTQTDNADVSSVPPIGSGGYYFRSRFESNCNLQFHQQALFRWVWTLPVGRGEAYLSNANKIVNGVLGGWRLTGAAVFQTGHVAFSLLHRRRSVRHESRCGTPASGSHRKWQFPSEPTQWAHSSIFQYRGIRVPRRKHHEWPA